MQSEYFKLKSEFIQLNKLLKLLRIAQSGAHAKILIEDREVKVNNQIERRKRTKLRPGDVIQIANRMITIKASER
ncbi:MAG: RNA-binding S4 domain-containing protein [Bacteroidales bacterium]|nr:RNA-binding S4 domain-containing protein [Bacteroidales bacterium]